VANDLEEARGHSNGKVYEGGDLSYVCNSMNTFIGNQGIYSDNIIDYGSYKGHTTESNLRPTTIDYMGHTVLLYYSWSKELYITGHHLLQHIMAILDLLNGNTIFESGPYQINYYGNKANTVYSEALYHDVMELLSDVGTGIYGSTIHIRSNIGNIMGNTKDLLQVIQGKDTSTY
jgi:hypothetical protein